MTTRKRQPPKEESPPAAEEWLPDPKDVIEEIDVHSPEDGDFKIQRTNIVDPYDEPLPPAPKKRKVDLTH